LIKEGSDVLLKVLGEPLDSIFITVQNVKVENSSFGGLPVLLRQTPTSPWPGGLHGARSGDYRRRR
jgi:phenylpyruvate tautomerase PptA (4-oxalocrotonate tautomerase family)